MLRLVAPNAFRSPISCVRSLTANQHDIDYANGAQSQRYHPYRSEKHVHNVENSSDHFRFLDRIPFVKGVLIFSIEVVIAAKQSYEHPLSPAHAPQSPAVDTRRRKWSSGDFLP